MRGLLEHDQRVNNPLGTSFGLMPGFFSMALLALLCLPFVAVLWSGLAAPGIEWSTSGARVTQTVGFAALGAVAAVTMGTLAAIGLTRVPLFFRCAAAALLTLPLLLPASLWAVAWIMVLGRDGVFTSYFSLPFTAYDWPVAALITGARWVCVPAGAVYWVLVRQHAAWPVESVQLMSSWAKIFWLRGGAVLGPLILSFVIVFVFALGDAITPSMLLAHTAATDVLVVANALLEPQAAMRLALPWVCVLAGLTLLLFAFGLSESGTFMREAQEWPKVFTAKQQWGGVLIAGVVLMVCAGLPMAATSVRAGSFATVFDAAVSAKQEVGFSLLLALFTGFLCIMLGALIAAVDGRVTRKVRNLACAVMVVLPPVILALGVLQVFEWPGVGSFRNSILPLYAGYMARYAPLMALLFAAASRFEDDRPNQAAVLLGVRPLRRIIFVQLPARIPLYVAAGGLTGLLVIADLELSLLLVPPGNTTLGVRLYTLIHTAPDAMVSGLAVFVILMTAAIMLCVLVAFLSCRCLFIPRSRS